MTLVWLFTGVLPEGEYDRNTKIQFCCRNDGNAGDAIVLPTNSPFHLLMWGDRCQEVSVAATQQNKTKLLKPKNCTSIQRLSFIDYRFKREFQNILHIPELIPEQLDISSFV